MDVQSKTELFCFLYCIYVYDTFNSQKIYGKTLSIN